MVQDSNPTECCSPNEPREDSMKIEIVPQGRLNPAPGRSHESGVSTFPERMDRFQLEECANFPGVTATIPLLLGTRDVVSMPASECASFSDDRSYALYQGPTFSRALGAGEPEEKQQVPPLRYPGFPVDVGGVG